MNQTSYGREGVHSEHLYARGPYTSTVSNYNRYLHELLQLVGEEFNDTVITEVRSGGIICRNEQRKWELCTSHTGRRTFISYNVMRCQTEAEVRKCSGHKSMKTFERYITFDEDRMVRGNPHHSYNISSAGQSRRVRRRIYQ